MDARLGLEVGRVAQRVEQIGRRARFRTLGRLHHHQGTVLVGADQQRVGGVLLTGRPAGHLGIGRLLGLLVQAAAVDDEHRR